MSRMRRRGQQRSEGVAGHQPAAVIACDEMWTYQQARRKDKRQNLWVWTAVVAEPDGRRWVDSEVGDRSENTFARLYARLPEAELYRSDDYAVYGEWLPRGRHVSGKGGAMNWNEGLHWWCRGKLNRLVRRTKGYTKSPDMLACSLALVLADWPSKPNTRL